MKLFLENKAKKEIFIALFQTLKNCSSLIHLIFNQESLFIQGMDKSHVCMFEVKITNSWFDSYDFSSENDVILCLDSQIFSSVLNLANDHYSIQIYQDVEEQDEMHIDLVKIEGVSGEFSKYFKIPLTDSDYEYITYPTIDYDAEFSISSKKICEITNQMLLFGTDIAIQCSEEKINLITNGISGEMSVNIPIDDLKEYSIAEGEVLDLKYSLTYISKMCLTNKLSPVVDFSIGAEFPMRIHYDLGEESSMTFFIAPKIVHF